MFRTKKAMASKLAKTEKGSRMIEEKLGEDGTALMSTLNEAIQKHFNEKVAKMHKQDTYKFLMKFQFHVDEGLQDEALRAKTDERLGLLTRQFRIALKESVHLDAKLQKAEAHAVSDGLKHFGDSVVELGRGNMRDKNLDKLKSLITRLADPEFLQKLLFDNSWLSIRNKLSKAMDAVYERLLTEIGDVFFNSDSHLGDVFFNSEQSRDNTDDKKSGQNFNAQMAEQKKTPTCSIPSCGLAMLYAETNFRGSPFCALHHFKAFSAFNKKGPAALPDWMEDHQRRQQFQRFLKVYSPNQLSSCQLYHEIVCLHDEESGEKRALIAHNVLKELVKTAGQQMTKEVRQKIKSLITKDNAPRWIFDSLLPRLETQMEKAYKEGFVHTSTFKLYNQTARLPDKQKEELAWQLTMENNISKGSTIGFTFKNQDDQDDLTTDKKKRPFPIDTNKVLQPFAVEKDRSPTIRRIRPGEEEPDPELPNGELRPEGNEYAGGLEEKEGN